MKIGVACTGSSLDDQVSERFGRCPYLLIVDSESRDVEPVANPGASMSGGAGPAAVNELVNRGVEVALAGEFGPKAQRALDTAGVRSVKASGKVSDALATLAD
jgi:predicted Fe-Mo cluster-binding NifX family protein